jgi:threonyl-tRNA synthetase
VYGTAWQRPEQLKAYIKLKEEAARRDHRKLGAELNLFSIQESAGQFWFAVQTLHTQPQVQATCICC